MKLAPTSIQAQNMLFRAAPYFFLRTSAGISALAPQLGRCTPVLLYSNLPPGFVRAPNDSDANDHSPEAEFS